MTTPTNMLVIKKHPTIMKMRKKKLMYGLEYCRGFKSIPRVAEAAFIASDQLNDCDKSNIVIREYPILSKFVF